MKIALFSDVHANLPALEAVLGDLDLRDDIEAVYHLGDLVGYAPWPNEVAGLIRERGVQGVGGNYDSTVAAGYDHCQQLPSTYDRRVISVWSQQRLSA